MYRRKIQSKAASREKDKREIELKSIAESSRDERMGIKPSNHEADEVRERDQIRFERQQNRERDRRIDAAAPEKRDRLKV